MLRVLLLLPGSFLQYLNTAFSCFCCLLEPDFPYNFPVLLCLLIRFFLMTLSPPQLLLSLHVIHIPTLRFSLDRLPTTSQTQRIHRCVCTSSLSCVPLFATPWTVACQAPLSVGILQTRKMEWVPKSSSRGSSQPRDRTTVSCIADRIFTIWTTREACIHSQVSLLFLLTSIFPWMGPPFSQ